MSITRYYGNSIEYVYSRMNIGDVAILSAAKETPFSFSQLSEFQKELVDASRYIKRRKVSVLKQKHYASQGDAWTCTFIFKKIA